MLRSSSRGRERESVRERVRERQREKERERERKSERERGEKRRAVQCYGTLCLMNHQLQFSGVANLPLTQHSH